MSDRGVVAGHGLAVMAGWTTAYFVAGLILTFGAPAVGVVATLAAHRRVWAVRFGFAFGFAVLIGLVLSVIDGMATAPLLGQTVESPVPPYRGCVAYSGGSNNCPGG